jgi:hypothetical protein
MPDFFVSERLETSTLRHLLAESLKFANCLADFTRSRAAFGNDAGHGLLVSRNHDLLTA